LTVIDKFLTLTALSTTATAHCRSGARLCAIHDSWQFKIRNFLFI